MLRATRTFVLVRDDGRYNVVLDDEAGRLVDVHAFDDTTTELGPDGIERHGPDGLPYEAGGFTGEGRIEGRTVRCMSAAFQMRSHNGYALDDGDRHDVLHLHRRFGLAIPPGTKSGSTGRRTVTEPPPARVASGEHQ